MPSVRRSIVVKYCGQMFADMGGGVPIYTIIQTDGLLQNGTTLSQKTLYNLGYSLEGVRLQVDQTVRLYCEEHLIGTIPYIKQT